MNLFLGALRWFHAIPSSHQFSHHWSAAMNLADWRRVLWLSEAVRGWVSLSHCSDVMVKRQNKRQVPSSRHSVFQSHTPLNAVSGSSRTPACCKRFAEVFLALEVNDVAWRCRAQFVSKKIRLDPNYWSQTGKWHCCSTKEMEINSAVVSKVPYMGLVLDMNAVEMFQTRFWVTWNWWVQFLDGMTSYWNMQ